MVTDNIKATWKELLSYTKTTWDLDDYPLRFKKQTGTPGQYNVGELKPWVVQIINWWTMTGLGDTKEEAYQMLKNNFDSYRQLNNPPRPGTATPLQFADTSRADKLEDIAVDFFEKILNLNYYECFISDDSDLGSFGKDDSETLNKINSVYNLGLTDLADGNIVRLLTLIKDKKGSR